MTSVAVGPGEQRVLFEVRRNLSEIGIETRFTARGDRLMGRVALVEAQMLRCPGGGPLIESVSFSVGGDGLLRMDEPASLRGLTGPHGAKLASLDALADALRKGIDSRFAKLRGEASRLGAFGLQTETDTTGMRLIARVDLEPLGLAVLESDGVRLVARELIGQGGPTPLGDLEIDLARFADRTDLERFLNAEVLRLLPELAPRPVVTTPPEADLDPEEISAEVGAIISGLLPPNPGEHWEMEVRLDSDDGQEVRYRGVDITGATFGAPRVLPKPAFDALYDPGAQSHRMCVKVLSVWDQKVRYVKLERDRRPDGNERVVSLAGFLANFTVKTTAD